MRQNAGSHYQPEHRKSQTDSYGCPEWTGADSSDARVGYQSDFDSTGGILSQFLICLQGILDHNYILPVPTASIAQTRVNSASAPDIVAL